VGRLRQARVLGGDVAQDKAKQVEEVSQSMDASGKQPWVDQPLSPLVVAGEVKVFDTRVSCTIYSTTSRGRIILRYESLCWFCKYKICLT